MYKYKYEIAFVIQIVFLFLFVFLLVIFIKKLVSKRLSDLKNRKYLASILLLVILIPIYFFTLQFGAFWISNPPNKCDLVTGINNYRDYQTLKKDGCLYDLALSEKKPEICEGIYAYDLRFRCLTDLAGFLNNSNLCQKIEKSGYRDKCLLSLQARGPDEHLCLEMSTYMMRNCLRELLKKNPSATYCAKVKDKHMADDCYVYVANEILDKSLCGYIQDGQYNTTGGFDRTKWCKITVEARMGNKNICTDIIDNSHRDTCYGIVSYSTNNTETCQFILDGYNKKRCYENSMTDIYKPSF